MHYYRLEKMLCQKLFVTLSSLVVSRQMKEPPISDLQKSIACATTFLRKQ